MCCGREVESCGSGLLPEALTATISTTPAAKPRYHRMPVIHISRTETANDFDGLIVRAGNGDEILIESSARVVARLLPGEELRPHLLSESLRILKERGSTVILDGDFGRDLEETINGCREPLNPPGMGLIPDSSVVIAAERQGARQSTWCSRSAAWPTISKRLSLPSISLNWCLVSQDPTSVPISRTPVCGADFLSSHRENKGLSLVFQSLLVKFD